MDLSLALMPFQERGVEFLASRKRAMLGWEMGTGKTPTAVRACAKVKAQRVLVFCPPIATGVWAQHFRDWSYYWDIRVYDGQAPYGFIEGRGVRIIPYSRASLHASVIAAASKFSDQWDVVILDECHYLKNPGAKRTLTIYGADLDLKGTPLAEARHVWALSGTPILNSANEFWTHLCALAPELITFPKLGVMSEYSFTQRYCVTRPTPYGLRVVGNRNATELASRVRSFMDRKRLTEVVRDMPRLRIVEHPLPEDTPVDIEVNNAMRAAMKDLGSLGDDELLAAFQGGSVAYSTTRRLVGMAKVPGTVELVGDMLEADPGKVIVFAHHRDVIRELVAGIDQATPLKVPATLVIHGDTPPVQRAQAIHLFQTDPRYRVIVLAIEAAGEAITLNASHNVVIAEPSPVPAKNAQAIARAWRMGQKHPVLARFVVLPGGFDALFMELIARKTRDIMQIVDPELTVPKPTAQFDLFEETPI